MTMPQSGLTQLRTAALQYWDTGYTSYMAMMYLDYIYNAPVTSLLAHNLAKVCLSRHPSLPVCLDACAIHKSPLSWQKHLTKVCLSMHPSLLVYLDSLRDAQVISLLQRKLAKTFWLLHKEVLLGIILSFVEMLVIVSNPITGTDGRGDPCSVIEEPTCCVQHDKQR